MAPSSHKRKVEAAGYAPPSTLASNQLEPALHQLDRNLPASYDLKPALPASYELESALPASYELERKLSASYEVARPVSATYQMPAGQYQPAAAGQYHLGGAGQYQPAAAGQYQLGGGGLPEPYPPDWPQIDRCLVSLFDVEPYQRSVSKLQE